MFNRKDKMKNNGIEPIDVCCLNVSGNGHECSRPSAHPGACRASGGHWWAQYESGSKVAYAPLKDDPHPVADMRGIWT
jgi:hypothetical protein